MIKKNKKKSAFILLVVLLLLYAISQLTPLVFRYKTFGIYLPPGDFIHGIDVSKYQENIDWIEVERMRSNGEKIQFAFIKATEGVSILDAKFNRNWKNIKKTKITKGAYHFFRPGFSASVQANFFYKNVSLEKGDLPPVLDIEKIDGVSKEVLQQRVLEWLDIIEKYYHVKPIIYTYADYYQNYLNDSRFEKYIFWVAHYKQKNAPRTTRAWHFWQHSESGRVNSIKEYVDFNVFDGSYNDLKKILIN